MRRESAESGLGWLLVTWLDLGVVGVTFLLIFPAELPDKTFVATLVLSTRFPRLWVWIGVALAFAVQCGIAVAAGGVLSLLPQRLVLGITFLLFAAGAVLMIVSGLRAKPTDGELAAEEDLPETNGSPWRVMTTSFVVLFTAEWGDLSQILTAGMAARTDSPVSVFLGSWTALLLVAAIAVLVGGWLQERVAMWRIRTVSGVVLAALAIWTLVEFVQA